MTVEYSPQAVSTASRFLGDDPVGLRAALDAADALADGPDPEASVRWGATPWRRLRAGRYRILYVVEGELITVHRVDRVTAR